MDESICKKKRFATKEEAKVRLKQIKLQLDDKRERTPLRVYPCEVCGGFHLTSMTKSEQRIVQKRQTPEWQFRNRISKIAHQWINKKKWDAA